MTTLLEYNQIIDALPSKTKIIKIITNIIDSKKHIQIYLNLQI